MKNKIKNKLPRRSTEDIEFEMLLNEYMRIQEDKVKNLCKTSGKDYKKMSLDQIEEAFNASF